MKNIGRYPIFKLVNNDCKFHILRKNASYKEFLEHYNVGKVSRVVGFTPDYVGFEPVKQVKNDNVFLNYIISNWDNVKRNTSPSFFVQLIESAKQPRVVYSRGYEATYSHFNQFLQQSEINEKYTDESILRILNYSKFEWFISPRVVFYGDDEVWGTTRVNLNAYPGHYTSKIAGRTKEASNLVSRKVAQNIFNQLKKEPVKNCYLWTTLSREKDIKVELTNGEDVVVGNRVVMCTENPMSLLLTMFSQRIHCALNTVSDDRMRYHLAGKFDADKYLRLLRKERMYDYKLEADWRNYDANIDERFIRIASTLLLQNLPDDDLHKNIRYLITSSLITKYVAVPPGVVIEVNKGVPSGHPFTTLINCNVNLIYWSLIGYNIYGEEYYKYMDVEVYGDDAVVFFKYHSNLSKIDDIINDLGLKSETLYTKLKLCNFDYKDEENIDFLKRRYDERGVRWNYKKLFDKLFYQSKKRNYNEQLELLISFYETAPDDEDLRWFMNDCVRKVTESYTSYKFGKNIACYLDEEVSRLRHDKLRREYSTYVSKNDLTDYNNFYLNLYSKQGIFHKYYSYYEDSEWDEWRTKQTLLLFSINLDLYRGTARLRKLRRYMFNVRGEDWNQLSLSDDRAQFMESYKTKCNEGISSYFKRLNRRINQ